MPTQSMISKFVHISLNKAYIGKGLFGVSGEFMLDEIDCYVFLSYHKSNNRTVVTDFVKILEYLDWIIVLNNSDGISAV